MVGALPVGLGSNDNGWAMSSPAPVADHTEDFGPLMLALEERQRKFVTLRVWEGKNPTQAARGAGYAGKTDGYLRVQGHRLSRSLKIIAAMREESERLFSGAAPLAIAGLVRQLDSKNVKLRAAAIDSVLDRTGYGRKTTQDIRVEHVDTRSTAELLALVAKLAGVPAVPAIEGKFEEVRDGATVDG